MIDEEAQRRVAELESQERGGKSKTPKMQKKKNDDDNDVKETTHDDISNVETEDSVQINVGSSTMTNGSEAQNGHVNGHTE